MKDATKASQRCTRWAVGPLVLCLASGCGAESPIARTSEKAAALSTKPAVTEADARAIVERVSVARGLSVDRAVPITLLDQAHFKRAVAEHMSDEDDPSGESKQNAFLAVFDFLPPKDKRSDLPSGEEVLEEQVAGFYSVDDDRIFVPDTAAKSDDDVFLEKAVLAHEATHALQARHFEIPKHAPSSDAELALTALVEGDAQVGMGAYLGLELGEPAGRTLRRIREATKRVPISKLDDNDKKSALARTFALARERLEFPYREGMMFVSDIYRTGGFDLVNQVYTAPPTTTAQILHPDKYLRGAQPRRFKPLQPEAGSTIVIDDVMGELQTRVLLERCFDHDAAASIASGWDGDRYTVLRMSGGALGVAWSTAWDSETDAHAFEEAITRPQCWSENELGGQAIPAKVFVKRIGDKVALVRGASAEGRDRLLKALLEEPGDHPAAVALSKLTIPPRVELPEPEAGKIRGDVYENEWLGVVARIPKGMHATLATKGEVGVVLDRPGEPVAATVTISTKLSTPEIDKELFGEATNALRTEVGPHGFSVQSLGGSNQVDTPLGKGTGRIVRVAGTTLEQRVILVPICAGTGSIVFVADYGDSFSKEVALGFVDSFRFTEGRNLKACDYLDPK